MQNKQQPPLNLVKIDSKAINFERAAFLVTADGIEEATLAELCLDAAEKIATPDGVAKKIHLRGHEIWTWGDDGASPKKLAIFDNEVEAETKVMDYYYRDLITNFAPVFFTEADAEKAFASTYKR